MSTLQVSYITTPSNTTPLVLSSANDQAAFVRIESANNDIVFNGFTKFLGGFSTSSINAAFDKANSALPNVSNAVFAGNLRVTGNLQIGMNTVTITDNHIISAEYYRMNTSNHMVVVPDANRVNTIFSIMNVSFDTANAAFASANNVGPQLAPAFNTANAAFAKANTSLQNTSFTLAGSIFVTGNGDFSLGTSYLKLPAGTTTQRPVGAAGMIRYNSTTNYPEWYDTFSSSWVNFKDTPSYTISYLAVAGGGGGGGGTYHGAGGGAGGLVSSTASISRGASYAITVGAGGSGGSGSARGSTGSDSAIATVITAYGGGGGGNYNVGSGLSGGSGGGAPYNYSYGSGTAGQGYRGGSGNGSAPNYGSGGGGGASAVGVDGTSTVGGNGGAGSSSSITGSSVTYAGGGGGSSYGGGTPGSGGAGGGGAGSLAGNNQAGSGTANLGGGGGGAERNSYTTGGAGGSGVVIISYASSTQLATGGTVTSYTSGPTTYWVHTFTSSGTFTA